MYVELPIAQMCFCEIDPCTRSKRFLFCCQLESEALEECEMVGLACPPRIRTARGSHLADLLAIFVALNAEWWLDLGAAGFCRHVLCGKRPHFVSSPQSSRQSGDHRVAGREAGGVVAAGCGLRSEMRAGAGYSNACNCAAVRGASLEAAYK